MGRELVVGAVARKEGYWGAVVFEDLEGRRGIAPRSEGVDGRDGMVAFDLGEASAAYHGDVDGPCRRERKKFVSKTSGRAKEEEDDGKSTELGGLYLRSNLSGISLAMVENLAMQALAQDYNE